MRISYLIILLLLTSCDNHSQLTKESWIIISTTYLDEPLKLESSIGFADRHGNLRSSIYFRKNGEIILPGIKSSEIRGNWRIENKQIYLTIDSSRYNFIYKTDEELSSLSDMESDSSNKTVLDSTNAAESQRLKIVKSKNPLETGEFRYAMKVYSNPFSFNIKKGGLILESSTTKIMAVRDRSIDELFEGL